MRNSQKISSFFLFEVQVEFFCLLLRLCICCHDKIFAVFRCQTNYLDFAWSLTQKENFAFTLCHCIHQSRWISFVTHEEVNVKPLILSFVKSNRIFILLLTSLCPMSVGVCGCPRVSVGVRPSQGSVHFFPAQVVSSFCFFLSNFDEFCTN